MVFLSSTAVYAAGLVNDVEQGNEAEELMHSETDSQLPDGVILSSDTIYIDVLEEEIQHMDPVIEITESGEQDFDFEIVEEEIPPEYAKETDIEGQMTINPFAAYPPSATVTSIPNTTVGKVVTVRATASSPCYRISASYTVNGVTTWLGEVYSSSYRRTFTPTVPGTYTVTLYSRSYIESNIASSSEGKPHFLS